MAINEHDFLQVEIYFENQTDKMLNCETSLFRESKKCIYKNRSKETRRIFLIYDCPVQTIFLACERRYCKRYVWNTQVRRAILPRKRLARMLEIVISIVIYVLYLYLLIRT